jgi:hypothetical protein
MTKEALAMTPPAPAPAGVRPAALAGPLLGDVIAPAVTYYLARGLGAPAAAALILGGLSCLPRQVITVARRRRPDGLGTAVLAALALGGLLALWAGSARLLVARDAIWPLAAGAVAAGSCLRGKPVSFYLMRPLLTGGQVENRPFWEDVWAEGSPFRHCLRILAAGWSVILLATGAVELLLALSLPVTAAAAVTAVGPVAVLALLLGGTALYGKRTGLGIRRSFEAMAASGYAAARASQQVGRPGQG